jgi:hypothetical protein
LQVGKEPGQERFSSWSGDGAQGVDHGQANRVFLFGEERHQPTRRPTVADAPQGTQGLIAGFHVAHELVEQ